MFEQSLLDAQGTKTKTKYTVFMSFLLECVGPPAAAATAAAAGRGG